VLRIPFITPSNSGFHGSDKFHGVSASVPRDSEFDSVGWEGRCNSIKPPHKVEGVNWPITFGGGRKSFSEGKHRQRGCIGYNPPAARSVAATNVTSVYQTDVTSAGPTDTLCLCSNVLVGPADIKSVWATNVTSVASGQRYRGGL
jgi:hypothetical protein